MQPILHLNLTSIPHWRLVVRISKEWLVSGPKGPRSNSACDAIDAFSRAGDSGIRAQAQAVAIARGDGCGEVQRSVNFEVQKSMVSIRESAGENEQRVRSVHFVVYGFLFPVSS